MTPLFELSQVAKRTRRKGELADVEELQRHEEGVKTVHDLGLRGDGGFGVCLDHSQEILRCFGQTSCLDDRLVTSSHLGDLVEGSPVVVISEEHVGARRHKELPRGSPALCWVPLPCERVEPRHAPGAAGEGPNLLDDRLHGGLDNCNGVPEHGKRGHRIETIVRKEQAQGLWQTIPAKNLPNGQFRDFVVGVQSAIHHDGEQCEGEMGAASHGCLSLKEQQRGPNSGGSGGNRKDHNL